MEQLQIHSRSYIVRWISVKAGESISWTLQPHKKSLNFGIFKRPGGISAGSPNLPTSGTFDALPVPTENGTQRARRNSKATDRDTTSDAAEKLQSIGLKCVAWKGKCEADQVAMGTFDVHEGEDGMYALVFDNTFSKTVSKNATFVLLTHATNAPPKSGAQLRYSNAQAAVSSASLGRSPSLVPHTGSSDSLPALPDHSVALKIPRRRSSAMSLTGSFFTGVMHKKRRKKAQGYARRFFSLDFATSTLSYYRNSHASALRGSIPLSLASIGMDDNRKEFTIDSGAEVWHLRLRNKKDFDSWRTAFERASAVTTPGHGVVEAAQFFGTGQPSASAASCTHRDWQRVEELVGRIAGTRDAVRRLAQDTAGSTGSKATSPGAMNLESPFFPDMAGPDQPKLPFWKRKSSTGSYNGNAVPTSRRSVSAQGGVPPNAGQTYSSSPPIAIPKIVTPLLNSANDIHERCEALLHDLDSTVSEFSSLLAECKARSQPPQPSGHGLTSRMSMESTRSSDFFDAEDGTEGNTQILAIRNSDELEGEHDDFYSDEESITSSDGGTAHSAPLTAMSQASTLFPDLPKSLIPSEIPAVTLRDTIPPPKQPPPSIIGFLRKNAGKDLSTVSMPVTANEPTSLLQRLAEPMENAQLLTAAAALTGDDNATERLLLVSAFAVSAFASNKIKERAVRKPFNPMLGETYELVRPESAPGDKFRFLAEKVTHHPVRMAWQADSLSGTWSMSQSPRPVQKFWGKSVELNTDGKVRLTLQQGEHYSWIQPTAYLRNVIAGEKYVEPTGTLTVLNETTGAKAVATFKASGMFSGRSEDVAVALYAPGQQAALPLALSGKWTISLARSDTGAEVWRAGPASPDAAKGWGFPAFSAQLNEVTAIEEGRMAPTDSRRRPDQRAFEEGMLDQAEALKARLEERQRSRRKVLESHGGVYAPRFFGKVEGEGEDEVWQLKSGKEGYWECRERGDWKGVLDVFEV